MAISDTPEYAEWSHRSSANWATVNSICHGHIGGASALAAQNDDPVHYHVFHIGHAIWTSLLAASGDTSRLICATGTAGNEPSDGVQLPAAPVTISAGETVQSDLHLPTA